MGIDRFQEELQRYWGYSNFRGIQRDIIESIAQGKDTLGLMPTGGGKSITFQVPALVMPGVCIVITPLIALMRDQVENLRQRGILAAAIYSGLTRKEIIRTLENCIFGGVKILYVSPERLSSDIFLTKLKHMDVSFITIDEAHCISQWGYDFRPSYLAIANIRKIKPDVAILALTATATLNVIDDIQEQLLFKEKRVFRMSFERKNLAYIVREATDKLQQMKHILASVNGSAIVYVRSRKHAKEISEYLNLHKFSSTFYHAGLESAIKNQRQSEWQTDQIRIMVATNAFGMGIDKPDVRVVIHIDCPDSIEAYFQEAGRGGRDGKKAYAVLLWNDGDKRKLYKRIVDNFPNKEYIKEVYEHLAYYYQIGTGSGLGHTFIFQIDKFCRYFKHFPVQTDSALRIIERAGYLHYEVEPDAKARLVFNLNRNELYKLEENSEQEQLVIETLLRNYGGLFTDFVYIDESMIAMEAGIETHQVYIILKNLSRKNIVKFIPQRKTPLITYLRERIEGERLIIPQAVYEDRKQQFERRIESMIAYATNDSICRSRQLLRYFGEERTTDCNQCDVCNSQTSSTSKANFAKEKIIELLSDKQKHHITELHHLQLPKEILDITLELLINEEEIYIDGSFLYIT